MNDQPPEHHENRETCGEQSLQQFEAQATPGVPGHGATQRPADRPRVSPSADAIASEIELGSLQVFDDEATPIPPGVKAKPRPEGRPRQ